MGNYPIGIPDSKRRRERSSSIRSGPMSLFRGDRASNRECRKKGTDVKEEKFAENKMKKEKYERKKKRNVKVEVLLS